MADSKQKAKQAEIKVTAKNRPTRDEANLKLKQLSEFLSGGESPL